MEFPYFVSACCEQRFQTVSPKGLQKSPSFWRISPHKKRPAKGRLGSADHTPAIYENDGQSVVAAKKLKKRFLLSVPALPACPTTLQRQ
jgi:hypothetical protein